MTDELMNCQAIANFVNNIVTPRTVRDYWAKRPGFPEPVKMPVPTRELYWKRSDIVRYFETVAQPG